MMIKIKNIIKKGGEGLFCLNFYCNSILSQKSLYTDKGNANKNHNTEQYENARLDKAKI